MLEWIVPVTDVVVTLLLLLIGGNLGSFLNVVVHRLPRGESVVVGGSRCPRCAAPIRWHDNVPVVGWLLLGGRCRDCRAPISPRYPVVEAIGAIVLGGVAAVELLSGGATLPGPQWGGGRAGADNLLLRPDVRLIAIAAFHAWLLFLLLAQAAIEADGDVPPRRFRELVLAISLVLVTVCPFLLPVSALPRSWGVFTGPSWLTTRLAGLIAGVAGAVCGSMLARRGSDPFRAGMTLVGAALGWQASIGVFVLVAIWGWLRRCAVSLVPVAPTTDPSDGETVARAAPPPIAVDLDEPPRGEGGAGDGTIEPAPDESAGEGNGDPWGAVRRYAGGNGAMSADLVAATATFLVLWRRSQSLWP